MGEWACSIDSWAVHQRQCLKHVAIGQDCNISFTQSKQQQAHVTDVPWRHAWAQQPHDTRGPRCAGPCPNLAGWSPIGHQFANSAHAPHMMAPNCPFPPHFARFQATHPPSGITNSSKKRGAACMRCMRPWWPLKHLLRHAEVRTTHVWRWSTTDTGYVHRHWIPTDTTRIGVSTADMRV